MEQKILVCGFGNKLKKDDGLGPYIIEKLSERKLPDYVSLRDFGTSGFRAALEIGNYDTVIVVDAINAGHKPGTLYRLVISHADAINSTTLTSFFVSLHESDLQRTLATAALIGQYPKRVIILGIEPLDISFGLTQSDIIADAMDGLIDIIFDEIKGVVGVGEKGF